jgi:hypothetical protein
MRRLRIWLVGLPLLITGSEVAHTVLNRFAPPGYKGAELFERSGFGSSLVPLLVSLVAAVVIGGLAIEATSGRSCRLSRGLFAALPLLVFTIQEHVEYTLGHGHPSWTLVLQRSFAIGLALQLPFAFAAYVAARLLLVLAAAIARRRTATRRVRGQFRPLLPAPTGLESPQRGRLPGDSRLNRGPPQLVVH